MATWEDHARCREIGDTVFVPTHDDANASYPHARKICARCPVRTTCLETAMRAEGTEGAAYRAGIWGGLNPQERYALHRRRRDATAQAAA